MKYTISEAGKLKIDDCTYGVVVITVKKESFTIAVDDVLKVVAETDDFFKIQYKHQNGDLEWWQFKAGDCAKSLANILYTECVGCGNKKVERIA